jgi:hypothetical protein
MAFRPFGEPCFGPGVSRYTREALLGTTVYHVTSEYWQQHVGALLSPVRRTRGVCNGVQLGAWGLGWLPAPGPCNDVIVPFPPTAPSEVGRVMGMVSGVLLLPPPVSKHAWHGHPSSY